MVAAPAPVLLARDPRLPVRALRHDADADVAALQLDARLHGPAAGRRGAGDLDAAAPAVLSTANLC